MGARRSGHAALDAAGEASFSCVWRLGVWSTADVRPTKMGALCCDSGGGSGGPRQAPEAAAEAGAAAAAAAQKRLKGRGRTGG